MVPSGCPALTAPPADFFAPLPCLGENALLRAAAPLPATLALMLEIVAPKPLRATVPPETVAQEPTLFFPTLAVTLPGPPLAPRISRVRVTFVFPFPRFA